jgi:hypothetical protein
MRPVSAVQRPGMNTLSSSSPRTPGWTNIGVGVGLSGRGEPPLAHADVCGRKPPPQRAHDREVGQSGKRGGGLLAEQMRRVAIAEDRRELGV